MQSNNIVTLLLASLIYRMERMEFGVNCDWSGVEFGVDCDWSGVEF